MTAIQRIITLAADQGAPASLVAPLGEEYRL